MSTTRREFLKSGAYLTGTALGASAFGPMAPRLVYGAEKAKVDKDAKTLVVVYLRGGCDALNTVIPFADPRYYELRPTIGIAPRDQGEDKGVVKLDNFFGFHPSLSPLMPLYEKGHVATVINVGSPNDTRSHFDAQDFMERAAPGIKTIVQGWLNRYLEATKDGKDNELRALSFQPLLPRSLRGSFPVLAVPDGDTDRMLSEFEDLYTCEQKALIAKAKADPKAEVKGRRPAAPAVRPPITAEHAHRTIVEAGANEIRRLRELQDIINSGDRGEYPGSHFGRQMRDIATVIKAQRGLEIAAIDYEGWDHHAYQGGSEGTQAKMLNDVASVLAAFHKDMGEERMKRCVVLLMTEFGRTAKENGNNGTDHGRGGFMMAVGGPVDTSKQKLFGRWTGLEPQNLADKRDLPVTTDFRQVFAETLECMFQFDTMKHQAFPGFRPARQPLNFMKRATA
jgi:uncharacterized protein (DUF1501 family)